MSSSYAVEALRVSKVYPDGTEAVKEVTLRVPKGLMTSLLGPNGAGKTTLLNVVSGVIPPTKGEVLVLGENVWRSRIARKLIGFVPQEEGVWRELNVYENLLMAAFLYDVPVSEARLKARELIELMGLKEYSRKAAGKLSGGLRRRLSLAMALIHDPPVLILDEPTTGLDPAARVKFIELLKRLTSKEGKTVIMSTHISEDAELSDNVVIMNSGRLVAEGGPEELKRRAVGIESIIELGLWGEETARRAAELLGRKGVNALAVRDKVLVKVSDAESMLPQVLGLINGEGLRVRWAGIRRPSLSDVFRILTGEEIGGER